MKREILFRGKRIDNEEWVEGSLLITKFNTYIIPMYDESISYQMPISIISETIGQFTGLTDKNGVKIFEGDIMQHANPFDIPFVVNWDSNTASFVLNDNRSYCVSDRSFCVIGNIHDNKELIK